MMPKATVSKPTTITALRAASSLKELAVLLELEPKVLSYILYIYPVPKYSTFYIPKKKNGHRTIDAPNDRLKIVQRKLADLLNACVGELDEQHGRKAIAHGFREGRSVLTNASPHTGRRFVLNLDLEDFFPSVNFGRIRGFFISNNDFNLNPEVATVIAQIACNGNALPQGSPCSPIISNLVAHILDVRLVQLAKKYKCTYSRYADDLTFSTNQKEFPGDLATLVKQDEVWAIGNILSHTIANAGFKINSSKTRMQCRASRQTVTGLVVNKKVNIRDEYFRNARLMCHSLFSTGKYHLPGTNKQISRIHPIEGILNHIDHVRTTSDQRADALKKSSPLASRRLYRRFLYFKTFVAPEMPLILCEGPSDETYLKVAIHQLAAKFPSLIDTLASPPKLKVRFFKYRSRTSDLLHIAGGTAPLKPLIEKYDENIRTYNFSPLKHPVIILIDNDSGSKNILPPMNGKYKLSATLKTTAKFYPVCKIYML
jgi:retron-type reverse transcriptase